VRRGGSAALLNVAAGTPLLSAERVSFTYGDKPVELRRGLYLTERITIIRMNSANGQEITLFGWQELGRAAT
jgi:hypothetical protein